LATGVHARLFVPAEYTRVCGHLTGGACVDTPVNLPGFAAARAAVAALSDLVVTDVAFAGPDGPMTLYNKATPSLVDPTKTLYDIGVEYGKRACGSGVNAAQGANLAQRDPVPDTRREAVEAAALAAYNAVTAGTCKAAVCDTLALSVIHHMKVIGGFTGRLEWITFKYTDKSGHSVVVVNRAAGSDLGNFRTWGKECYTVDMWYKGLKSDSSLDYLTGNEASGIRWGVEKELHNAQESSAARSGIGQNYDSTWAGRDHDRQVELAKHDKAPAPTVYGLYATDGTTVVGEVTDADVEAMKSQLEKRVVSGKTIYVSTVITKEMVTF